MSRDYITFDELTAEKLGKEYIAILEESKHKRFKTNQAQFDKFVKVLNYFKNKCDDNDKIEHIDLKATGLGNGMNCCYTVFEVNNDEMEEFIDIMKCVDNFSIDATIDNQVCISLSINNIFIPIDDDEIEDNSLDISSND